MKVKLVNGKPLMKGGKVVTNLDCCCGATGGCCIDGECSILSEAACIAAGGTFQGVGTPCEPNPCGCILWAPVTWVRFEVLVATEDSSNDNADLIAVGSGIPRVEPNITAYLDLPNMSFNFNGDPFYSTEAEGFVLDEWNVVDFKFDNTFDPMRCSPLLNGVPISNDTGYIEAPMSIVGVLFGSVGYSAHNQRYRLRNLKIGTTGYGSSDLFNAALDTEIVPPFDSTTIDPGCELLVDGGSMLVQTGDNFDLTACAAKCVTPDGFSPPP